MDKRDFLKGLPANALATGLLLDAGTRSALANEQEGRTPALGRSGSGVAAVQEGGLVSGVVNVTDFGAKGDGTTNDTAAINQAKRYLLDYYKKTGDHSRMLMFPAGRYLIENGQNFLGIRLIGQSAQTTVIVVDGSGAIMFNLAQDISFNNARNHISAGVNGNVEIRNCIYNWTAVAGSIYLNYIYRSVGSLIFEGNTINIAGRVYTGIWVEQATGTVSIAGNRILGSSSHAVRINPHKNMGQVYVKDNQIIGECTTGIFLGSNRESCLEKPIIENNFLKGFLEEGIALDGFGNNAGLCPVIGNGPLRAATNIADGRLVITPDLLYYQGAHPGGKPNVVYPISSREDWANFYVGFYDGTGIEGTLAKIVGYDPGNGTLTLDTFTPANRVHPGGFLAVFAGFFWPVIRNNILQGSGGSKNNYATALSIYLNVFGAAIYDNRVTGCARSLQVHGGLMLSTYHTAAWHNSVYNNIFLRNGQIPGGSPSIYFGSLYNGKNQYGNKFINNTVDGGAILFEKQKNLLVINNLISDCQTIYRHCGNTLPPPDASQVGQTFTLITDDPNGNPRGIDHYVCKLSDGSYRWVSV